MNKLALIGLTAVAFTLTSCGGGGYKIPSNIVIPGNSQNYLNTPTYAVGTEELDAFKTINTFRNSMGLGYWQQNIYMDEAAQNHMAYSKANDPTFQQDLEVQYTGTTQNIGWSGITPSARAIAAGYFTTINTITAQNQQYAAVGELYSTGSGVNVLNTMVNTIYHRSGLMSQSTRVIGLGRDSAGVASPTTHWWINHGRIDSGQTVPSNYAAHYPLNQQLNVPLSMTMESPSVYTNYVANDFATKTSSPISFTTAAITHLLSPSFTVTQAGSATPLSGTTWTMNNDPNLNVSSYTSATNSLTTPPTPAPTIPAYEAYWVGNAPFLPNTTYNVTFTGTIFLTVYGISNTVTQTWSFTTGS